MRRIVQFETLHKTGHYQKHIGGVSKRYQTRGYEDASFRKERTTFLYETQKYCRRVKPENIPLCTDIDASVKSVKHKTECLARTFLERALYGWL